MANEVAKKPAQKFADKIEEFRQELTKQRDQIEYADPRPESKAIKQKKPKVRIIKKFIPLSETKAEQRSGRKPVASDPVSEVDGRLHDSVFEE